MDFLGIKVYTEQKMYQYRKWLNTSRGTYTNRDLVSDWGHLITTIVLLALVVFK